MSLEKELDGLINPNKDELKGTLGISSKVVEVSNRMGYVWVRLSDNPSELIKAYNPDINPQYNLPVKIKFDGRKYVVTGLDRDKYANWPSNQSFLGKHGRQHSAAKGAEGNDITWVDLQQFLPLLAMPNGSTGNSSIWVSPYIHRNSNGDWLYVGNTGTFGFPRRSSTGSNMYLLMMNDSDGTFYAITGSVFANSITGTADIVSKIPKFPLASSDIPVAAIRAWSNSSGTIANWSDIYNVRQLFVDPPHGGLTTGTVLSTIAVRASGTFIGSAKSLDFYPDYTVSMNGTRAEITYNDPIRNLTLEPTGFTDPENVLEYYNATNRTITVSGTVAAYWRGRKVPELVSGWTSSAHPSGTGPYFLSYDGSNFNWDTTSWTFDKLQIAYTSKNVGSNKFGIREPHGFLPWQAHEEFHRTIGTYKESGGSLSGYTAGSTTATDRRPLVSATSIHDEDIHTNVLALSTGTYTQASLTTTGTLSFVTDRADFVNLTGTLVYYNSYSAPNWGQTLVASNDYMSVWLVAIPTTFDAESRKYRYIWIQGQSSGNLLGQQTLSPSNLNLADFTSIASEFVFLAQVIIHRQGGSWEITSVTELTGNHFSQVGSHAGNFLTSVSTDATLTGDGTAGNPLSVVGGPGGGGSITIMEQDGAPTGTSVATIVVSNNTLAVSGTMAFINNIGAMGIEPIDISSQITGSGMTHFTYSPAASNIVVSLNGIWQKPGAVTVDGDGLGFTSAFAPLIGDTLIVARVTPPATMSTGTASSIPLDGWIYPSEVWNYLTPTTFSVSGDLTSKYTSGVKLKLTNGTVKYSYVLKSVYSAPNTIVTHTGGTSYTFSSGTLSNNYYSIVQSPQGFPDWFTWTPTWSGTITNPVLGNGTLDGRFRIDGKLVTAIMKLLMGSTTTYGSGNWRWLSPTSPLGYNLPMGGFGSGRFLDAGTAHYVCTSETLTVSGVDYLICYGNNVGNYFSDSAPFVWATNDTIQFLISYGIP